MDGDAAAGKSAKSRLFPTSARRQTSSELAPRSASIVGVMPSITWELPSAYLMYSDAF